MLGITVLRPRSVPCLNGRLKSLEYVDVGAFMKIFNTRSKEVATSCMEMVTFPLPSVCISNVDLYFTINMVVLTHSLLRLTS